MKWGPSDEFAVILPILPKSGISNSIVSRSIKDVTDFATTNTKIKKGNFEALSETTLAGIRSGLQ